MEQNKNECIKDKEKQINNNYILTCPECKGEAELINIRLNSIIIYKCKKDGEKSIEIKKYIENNTSNDNIINNELEEIKLINEQIEYYKNEINNLQNLIPFIGQITNLNKDKPKNKKLLKMLKLSKPEKINEKLIENTIIENITLIGHFLNLNDKKKLSTLNKVINKTYNLKIKKIKVRNIDHIFKINELFPEVNDIDFKYCDVKDISFLECENFAKLNKINLMGNPNINNCISLGNIKNLIDLDLSYCNLQNITFLNEPNFQILQNLNLRNNNALIDYNPLLNLISIKKLDLSFCKIKDIAFLISQTFNFLEYLNLGGNDTILDFSPVINLKNIRHLFLYNCGLKNINFLVCDTLNLITLNIAANKLLKKNDIVINQIRSKVPLFFL